MPRSLAARLAAASLCVLPILLAMSGYMLDVAFQRSVHSGEEEQLKTRVYSLLSLAELESGTLIMPEAFREERFNQLESGLYAIISAEDNKELWRSPSAALLRLPDSELHAEAIALNTEHFYTAQSNAGKLYVFHYDIVWQESDRETLLRISILHSQDSAKAEVAAYRAQLWRWLIVLTILIVAAQSLILRWSLRPLKKLSRDLKAVETGSANHLEGEYPSEIQSVTDNFNQVLFSEKSQRERYRNTLNDLAHSLKTPLSVIQSLLQKSEDNKQHQNELIGEQILRMNQIVSHQLARASHSNNHLPGQAVLVEPIVKRLCDSLKKVYFEKQTDIEINVAASTFFTGDERDLMELLGNLIDNAFKYGKQWLCVEAVNNDNTLNIKVSDDGPGVPNENREVILQRGARADTVTAGQGIGLAVSIDILSSYNGSLSIQESAKQGATFVMSIPLSRNQSITKR